MAMKAMKAAKAAAPPRRRKAMTAMKAMKAMKKSPKKPKKPKEPKKLESWMSSDTRDVPLVWAIAKWDGKKLTQDILHKDNNANQVIF